MVSQGVVTQVQTSIVASVSRVEEVRAGVELGRTQVDATRGLLKEAREAMTQLDERIRGISAATEQMGYAAQNVSQDVQQVASIAQGMVQKATAVSESGEQLHALADELLTAIGVFRLDAHREARQVTETLAGDNRLAGMQRRSIELLLRQALAQHDFFELLYVTDARGVQVSDNIAPPGFAASYGGTGHGQDWSEREWFRRARDDNETYVTPVYRSAATGQFCFTVASPIRDRNGVAVGLLGADVRLAALL